MFCGQLQARASFICPPLPRPGVIRLHCPGRAIGHPLLCLPHAKPAAPLYCGWMAEPLWECALSSSPLLAEKGEAELFEGFKSASYAVRSGGSWDSLMGSMPAPLPWHCLCTAVCCGINPIKHWKKFFIASKKEGFCA